MVPKDPPSLHFFTTPSGSDRSAVPFISKFKVPTFLQQLFWGFSFSPESSGSSHGLTPFPWLDLVIKVDLYGESNDLSCDPHGWMMPEDWRTFFSTVPWRTTATKMYQMWLNQDDENDPRNTQMNWFTGRIWKCLTHFFHMRFFLICGRTLFGNMAAWNYRFLYGVSFFGGCVFGMMNECYSQKLWEPEGACFFWV